MASGNIEALRAYVESGGLAKTVIENELLSKHSTMRCGGEASLFVVPKHMSDIKAIVGKCREFGVKFKIIGNGSNLLFADSGFDGLVLCLKGSYEEIAIENDVITASAAVTLPKLAMIAKDKSLSGLEFAAGIPATLGGAVYMNAGAYGGDMKQVLVSAEMLNENGEVVTMFNEDLKLSYRHSILKEEFGVVLSATLKLRAGDRVEIEDLMAQYRDKRRASQPLEFPSSGSTFKRPKDNFAGKLIEEAGLKSLRVGGAMVSEKHAGFIINYDHATAKDIIELIEIVRDKVYKNSAVMLETEVEIVR